MKKILFSKIVLAGMLACLALPAAVAAFHNETLSALEKALKNIDSAKEESPRKFVFLDATFYSKKEFLAEAARKGQSSSSRSRYFKEVLEGSGVPDITKVLDEKKRILVLVKQDTDELGMKVVYYCDPETGTVLFRTFATGGNRP